MSCLNTTIECHSANLYFINISVEFNLRNCTQANICAKLTFHYQFVLITCAITLILSYYFESSLRDATYSHISQFFPSSIDRPLESKLFQFATRVFRCVKNVCAGTKWKMDSKKYHRLYLGFLHGPPSHFVPISDVTLSLLLSVSVMTFQVSEPMLKIIFRIKCLKQRYP